MYFMDLFSIGISSTVGLMWYSRCWGHLGTIKP
jgi:hypothetical protein